MARVYPAQGATPWNATLQAAIDGVDADRAAHQGTSSSAHGRYVQALAPTTPNTNDEWLDTTARIVKVWDGTAWQPFGAAPTGIVFNVNGHTPVSGRVDVNAGDVGALTQAVADGRYAALGSSGGGGGTYTTSPRPVMYVVASSDAPSSVLAAADYQCDGTGDEQTINGATAAAPGGGKIVLAGFHFNTANTTLLRSNVDIEGWGWSTIINANCGSNPVFALANSSVEHAGLSHMQIKCNGSATNNAQGIYIINTGGTFSYNDPGHRFNDLLIGDSGSDSIYIDARARATRMNGVRVERSGAVGFNLGCADSFFADCETGGSAGVGVVLSGTNTHWTGGKSWYSKSDGFLIWNNRVYITGAGAQDNKGNGFSFISGHSSCVACYADSNGYDGLSSGYATGLGSGFAVASGLQWVRISDCQAYDKNENNRGYRQDYGVELTGSGWTYLDITCTTRTNRVARMLGSVDSTSYARIIGT